jgi:hypothetical protein
MKIIIFSTLNEEKNNPFSLYLFEIKRDSFYIGVLYINCSILAISHFRKMISSIPKLKPFCYNQNPLCQWPMGVWKLLTFNMPNEVLHE